MDIQKKQYFCDMEEMITITFEIRGIKAGKI